LEKHSKILVIFGTNVAKKVDRQMVLYFPTSPTQCFCTTCGNRKPKTASENSENCKTHSYYHFDHRWTIFEVL